MMFVFCKKCFRTSYVCAAQTTRRRLSLQCVCFLEDPSLKKVCKTSVWCRLESMSSYLFFLLFPDIKNTQNPKLFSIFSFSISSTSPRRLPPPSSLKPPPHAAISIFSSPPTPPPPPPSHIRRFTSSDLL
ncbi:hypothetical protein HanRHA438_Chr15g0688431 [Helianthus annuus]|nr:hypothetical protein HanRHA438_Chr15g0688431 [Helianthus annuus]